MAVLAGVLNTLFVVLAVAVTLGLVIFVHELGHFLVAKLCGVKVEKFYLGFDIYGVKLCRFRRGETEYGIGILPLGGYVKMLGQEDNPARLREEIQRAKQQTAAPPPDDRAVAPSPAALDAAECHEPSPRESAKSDPNSSDTRAAGAPNETPCADNIEHAQQALYDPRSYLAKSVPRRMAIISAGVVMNLVFALLCAVVALKIGVRQNPCGVGRVLSGMGAWQIGLRADDRIVSVGGKPTRRFRDMQEAVSLADDGGEGVPIVVERPGTSRPIALSVQRDKQRGVPMIGITSPLTTTLVREDGQVADPGSAASRAKTPFEPGDRVIALDGRQVQSYGQVHRHFVRNAERPIDVTVERASASQSPGEANSADAAPPRRVTIRLEPQPVRRLGLVMEIGPVVGVQAGSPAAAAGIRPGDTIAALDGVALGARGCGREGDPMTLADRLRSRAGQRVALRVRRGGGDGAAASEHDIRDFELAPTEEFPLHQFSSSPLSVPALGVAYEVTSVVADVLPGSPAAEAGLSPGDVITSAVVLPPPKEKIERLNLKQRRETIDFEGGRAGWPELVFFLQDTLPGTTVELHYRRDGREYEVILAPAEDPQWFSFERGLNFEPAFFVQSAESWGQAIAWGFDETVNATLAVYRFLQRLSSRDISPRMMAGPIGIISAAAHYAQRGFSDLLMFITLLSANLAVINFLPIPLLDGGHMVFLAYEGIRGKPADERVQTVLAYVGLFLLLVLLVWVFGLDLGFISREVPR